MAAGPGAGDAAGAPEAEAPEARRRRRRQLVLLLTPLTLATVAGFVASALTPTLLQKEGGHPLALIALDARNRNLILTASSVDAVPFFVVATLRLLAVDPFTYLLGRRYGDAGLRWVERRFSGMQPTIEFFERVFRRAAPVAVALAPGAVVCTLAGAAGMPVGLFFLFNVAGTLARIAILRITGDALADPVDALRRFFDRYIVWTTAASVLLVVLWVYVERRRGRAEVETPVELADELERTLDEARTTDPPPSPDTDD